MDTEKKPYKESLLAAGVFVEKYSGDLAMTQLIPAPVTLSNDAFMHVCKLGIKGICLHRDLPDTQTPTQEKLGAETKTILTDKEEYVFLPIEGIRSFRTEVINE